MQIELLYAVHCVIVILTLVVRQICREPCIDGCEEVLGITLSRGIEHALCECESGGWEGARVDWWMLELAQCAGLGFM